MSKCRRIQTQIILKKRNETCFIEVRQSKPFCNTLKTKSSLFLPHSTTAFCFFTDEYK